MTDEEIIEADAEPTPGVPAQQQTAPPAVLGGDPAERMQTAEAVVQYLASRCTGEDYIASIDGKRYPKVEWWTSVGAGLELFPSEEGCVRHDHDDGSYSYEAHVGVYSTSGRRVTRAGGLCRSDEQIYSKKRRTWIKRWSDEYAVRSMAVTGATAKAYLIGLSFLAVMAKLEPTPAEEMPPARPAQQQGSPARQGGGAQQKNQADPQLVQRVSDVSERFKQQQPGADREQFLQWAEEVAGRSVPRSVSQWDDQLVAALEGRLQENAEAGDEDIPF